MPTSPRTRAFSILDQLKAKGHKHAAGSTTDHVSAPNPTAAKASKMPPSLKDRGGRLKHFALVPSDEDNNADNQDQNQDSKNSSKPHAPNPSQRSQIPAKRSATPQKSTQSSAGAVAATRQELVEAVKLPVPKSGRYAHVHQREDSIASQPVLGSPPQITSRRPRANSDDRRDGLFAGSQLGDSFMASGLTTPQNEREEGEEDEVIEIVREAKKAAPENRPMSRAHFDRGARQSSEAAAFLLQDNGFMTVVPGTSHYHPALMKDGFQGSYTNGRSHAKENHHHAPRLLTSPAERRPKLPVREAKQRRPYDGHGAYDEAEPRSPSPTFESTRWQQINFKRVDPTQPTMFQEADEDAESSTPEPQMTPKATRTKPTPKKVLMESSMPPATASREEPKDKKRRRGSLDYDDRVLSSMAYAELQKQPFDHDPIRATTQNGYDARADDRVEKLERFRKQGEKEQRQLFVKMSMEEWEAAGDWFVDQFSDIMQKMKEARQNKRRIVHAFEAEIAYREEAVRRKADTIDQKLGKMKQDGQRVVADKDI